MSAYLGEPGGPRDPATPGPYCLSICRCGQCPQFAEQARHAQLLRDQHAQAQVRIEGEQWAQGQKPGRRTLPQEETT